MADDLVTQASEVDARAAAVLRFWLEETPADQRFAKDDALDREIATRFGTWRDEVLALNAVGWSDRPEPLLAAVILLDQFSRNIHRGTAAAYATDTLALALTHRALARGWDTGMDATRRQFLYLPLMHAEEASTQRLSVKKFASLGDDEVLAFARAHAEVIERFGRFPSRNAALGRASTAAEEEYLSQPGSGW